MPSANNEPLQLLGLLLGVLFPDLQVIDLAPVTIKLPVDLLQILPYHLGPGLHRGNQLLHLQGERRKLGSINLRLRPELTKLLISLVQTTVHVLLDLQHVSHLTFKKISLSERC